MVNKCCVSEACFLSSCCQTVEFQNACPNKFEKFRRGTTINFAAKDNVHIILSGVGLESIGLGSEEEMHLALLGKGHVFSIVTPFAGPRLKEKWNLSVQALTDLEVCKVPCNGLWHYTTQHPSILYGFLLAFKALNRSGVRQTWINRPRMVYERVVRVLVVLNELHGNDLNMSHDDIALIIDSERSSVTHALAKLQEEGLVTLEYRRIHLNPGFISHKMDFTLNRDNDVLSMAPSLSRDRSPRSRDMHT